MRAFLSACLIVFPLLCLIASAQQAPSTAVQKPAPSTPANSTAAAPATPSANRQNSKKTTDEYPADVVEVGNTSFQRHCAFCHGRDAGGGESGPDLTRSKLVATDVRGEAIGGVVRNGRVEKGMPRFNLSDLEIQSLAAWIHIQRAQSQTKAGGRKGVDPEDLQTGDVAAGKAYFNGEGQCSRCHSPEKDLAGIANRFQGLKLEQRMLYPRDVSSKVSVTASGKTTEGTLAYLDEFTVGLRDEAGRYRSWPVRNVKYQVDAPVEAHAEQLSKYTDADIHNLIAYLQTLK